MMGVDRGTPLSGVWGCPPISLYPVGGAGVSPYCWLNHKTKRPPMVAVLFCEAYLLATRVAALVDHTAADVNANGSRGRFHIARDVVGAGHEGVRAVAARRPVVVPLAVGSRHALVGRVPGRPVVCTDVHPGHAAVVVVPRA